MAEQPQQDARTGRTPAYGDTRKIGVMDRLKGVWAALMELLASLYDRLIGKKAQQDAKDLGQKVGAEQVEMDTTLSEFDDVMKQSQQSIDRMRDTLKRDAAPSSQASDSMTGPSDDKQPQDDSFMGMVPGSEASSKKPEGEPSQEEPKHEKEKTQNSDPESDVDQSQSALVLYPAGLFGIYTESESNGTTTPQNIMSPNVWARHGHEALDCLKASLSECSNNIAEYLVGYDSGAYKDELASVMFEVRMAMMGPEAQSALQTMEHHDAVSAIESMSLTAWESVKKDLPNIMADKKKVTQAVDEMQQGDVTTLLALFTEDANFQEVELTPEADNWFAAQYTQYERAIRHSDFFTQIISTEFNAAPGGARDDYEASDGGETEPSGMNEQKRRIGEPEKRAAKERADEEPGAIPASVSSKTSPRPSSDTAGESEVNGRQATLLGSAAPSKHPVASEKGAEGVHQARATTEPEAGSVVPEGAAVKPTGMPGRREEAPQDDGMEFMTLTQTIEANTGEGQSSEKPHAKKKPDAKPETPEEKARRERVEQEELNALFEDLDNGNFMM